MTLEFFAPDISPLLYSTVDPNILGCWDFILEAVYLLHELILLALHH